MQESENVTQLLIKWSSGDREALDRLMPLVYAELRRMARNYLKRERPDHTLEPTALVHEAYLKLVEQQGASWQNRAQFFGLAAKLMRNILVDHARERKAAKRGGEQYFITLSKAARVAEKPEVDLIALDDALNDLSSARPQHGRVVELRFFGGLTIEETAEVMGLSHATVERDWKFARAWLRTAIAGRDLSPSQPQASTR